jgi:general secretion pathway protein I
MARRSAMKRPTPRRHSGGFTLIEVVVAVAIAGLALVGLFRAGTGGLMSVEAAGRVDEALDRAQSHLAAFGRSGAVSEADLEGDDGNGFRWQLHSRPLAMEQPANPEGAPSIALFDVEVMISWRARSYDRSVVLNTQRIGVVALQ